MAYRWYIRIKSPAKIAASSPPAPARISKITLSIKLMMGARLAKGAACSRSYFKYNLICH